MRILSPAIVAGLFTALLTTACGGGGSGAGSGGEAPAAPLPQADTFSLAGTISVSDSQTVDSDTNDQIRQASENDTPASAQEIPAPTTLGGYVNEPNTGAEGRSQLLGDLNDFFRVDLLAGQQVTMLVADFEQADADLLLWNSQGTDILEFSAGTGGVESLIVPEDGNYLINAFAYAGASNYILAIGGTNLPAVYTATQHRIVPWQAVVKYREDGQLANTDAQQRMAAGHAMEQRAGARGRGRLMALRQQQLSDQQRRRRLGQGHGTLGHIQDPAARARWETLMAIKSLRKDPLVEYAEPNYQVTTLAIPNDEAYPLQWHYPLIGLPQAWDTTTGSPNVLVAVVDSGILGNHPDLAGQLVPGYDFVRDADSAQDGDGIDPDPEDPGGAFGGGSENFHGTHVSGTVAARGNNSIGVTGTAYTARVMPLRALGAGGAGTSYDVDQAIRYAAGLPNDSGTVPATPADIINLSLGGAPFRQATQDLFNEVRAAGILVVAAAGNEGNAAPIYPASYDSVISVSAVDAQRRLTAYSSTGAHIDVAAPGGDNSIDLNGDGYPDGVLSTGASITEGRLNTAYSFLAGTSMASPHVAGVLALMKSVNPSLTPADIDVMLANGQLTNDLGAPGRDNLFGHGLINAQQAVLAAVEASGTTPADNPRLVSSSNSLNFGSTATSLDLALSNGGRGDLQLLDLSVSQSWLRLQQLDVDASGLGEYRVSVDRSNLPNGIYAAEIVAVSTINTLSIRVIVAAGSPGTGADVGVLYILLYDSEQNEPIEQFVSNGNTGDYRFQFTNIPAGQYEIVAGSDADHDLLICDAGEACGAWLSIDQPIVIELSDNRDDLDFPVEYLVSLPGISSRSQDDSGEAKRPRLKTQTGN